MGKKIYVGLGAGTVLRLALLVPCLAASNFVPLAHGQVLYGTLTGNVTDSTGGALAQASVKAVNTETGFSRETKSNDSGLYSFSDLTPGTYTVTINVTGYGPFVQSGTTIQVNTVQRIDAVLKVGQVEETLTVTNSAPPLQTDKADTSFTLENKEIAALPTTSTEGRNFQSLLKIIPGSTPPAESNSAAGNPQRAQVYNVNGITNTTNTTRIDGAIDSYPSLSSLVAYLPPADGIESINIVTGSFNAEQGSAGGAAVNVTIKSGTNHFHGSLWEFNSIGNFNAQSWQNRTGVRQKNIYNEYGASFGGPILKDKLFFFGDWNRVTTSKAVTGALNTSSVPPTALRGGDFSSVSTIIYDPATGNPATGLGRTPFFGNRIPANRIAPAAATLLSVLPAPNATGAGGLNNYTAFPTTAFTRDNIDGKITYTPTYATSFFGHYSISPDTINDPQEFNINGGSAGGVTIDGGQPGSATGRIQNLGLGATHLIGIHILLDANAGYTRQHVVGHASDFSQGNYGVNTLNIPGTNNGSDANYSGIPGFYFSNGYNSLGNATTSSPFVFRDNQYTGNVNGTYTRGKHLYRFGGEYLHAAINHFQPGSLGATTPRGGFTFTGGVTSQAETGAAAPNQYNSLADFLLGEPNTLGKSVQSVDPVTLRYSEFAFFAQDTWQATEALVINYGVRYEYYPVLNSDHYGTLRYDPNVLTSVTDATGTHKVGTAIVGGEGGNSQDAGINNHDGMAVPRIGISYRANAKTVVRGGFGITVDPENLRSLLNAYPASVGLVVNGANSHLPAGALNAPAGSYVGTGLAQVGIPTLTIPNITSGFVPLPYNVSTYTVPKDFRRGYIESYNLTFERELPLKLVGTIAYVGTHAIRQQVQYDINAAPVGGGTAGRALNTQFGANNNITDIYTLLPFQGSDYNGLQAQLKGNAGRLGQFGVVYTYSKSTDVADNGELGTLLFVDPTFIQHNYATAGYDRKHNFQTWSILKSPVGTGKGHEHGLLSLVTGGWQLSDILSRVSGTPFNVLSAGTSLNAPGNTQVADYIPGTSKVLKSNVNGFRQYLNPAAYTPVTAVRFGNSGRDSVRGPGLFNIDTSLSRTFHVYRESAFVLQADAFNVTNTPQFANPAATISTPATFGIITISNSNRTMRFSGHVTF